jgi:hypothetical protein
VYVARTRRSSPTFVVEAGAIRAAVRMFRGTAIQRVHVRHGCLHGVAGENALCVLLRIRVAAFATGSPDSEVVARRSTVDAARLVRIRGRRAETARGATGSPHGDASSSSPAATRATTARACAATCAAHATGPPGAARIVVSAAADQKHNPRKSREKPHLPHLTLAGRGFCLGESWLLAGSGVGLIAGAAGRSRRPSLFSRWSEP